MKAQWTAGLCLVLAGLTACSREPASEKKALDFIASAENKAAAEQPPPAPLNVTSAPAGTVLAAWSQIVGNQASKEGIGPLTVVARFVVQGTGQDCGRFALRPDPAVDAEPPALIERDNPDMGMFPITLCQALMPPMWSAATLHRGPGGEPVKLWQPADKDGPPTGPDVSIPGPYRVGRKRPGEMVMVTTGDTGCRGTSTQTHCSDSSQDWPFNDLTTIAVDKYDPDFVIHVGDYRYYEQASKPDLWRYWYLDFFYPAQDLLANAPWAFSRGNHEQCHFTGVGHGMGRGWFYLLEATATSQTTRCPLGERTVQADPWYFDVAVEGPAMAAPQRFVFVDTGPSFPTEQDDLERYEKTMSAHFTDAIEWADAADAAGIDPWWVTHRPTISLTYYQNKMQVVEANVLALLVDLLQDKPPLCDPHCVPNTILSGHLHLYEKIEFFKTGETSGPWVWPLSMIVGNGGVGDYPGFDSYPTCTYTDFGAGVEAQGVMTWDTRHGLVAWTRSAETAGTASGWTAETYFLESAPSKSPEVKVCDGAAASGKAASEKAAPPPPPPG